MRCKLVTAVMAGLLIVAIMSVRWVPQDARAQDKPGGQRIEYKVVFCPVDSVQIRESVQVEGKIKEVSHGPKESAEAMTKQFNALAVAGWEYVGPVASTERQARVPEPLGGSLGVLVLFKRDRK